MRATLFRGDARRIPFEIEDGLEVLVYADVTVYEARGELQLVVRQVEPQGVGALQLAFEQLRARLEAEGLFDASHKRDLPEFPRRIGVVTSPDGAAIRDVLKISGARFPGIPILISPTRVQGEGAEEEIAAALEALDGKDVDVILLVRGGGSPEDLRPFNSERLARAVAAARTPIACGVGHETDITICDLVADLRAATPSDAAARAVPDRVAVAARIESRRDRLVSAVGLHWSRAAERLESQREALRRLAPAARLAGARIRLEALDRALWTAVRGNHGTQSARVEALAGRLDSLSPLRVLGRGFSIVRNAAGEIVRRSGDLRPGDSLDIRLSEGEVEASVTRTR